MKFKFKGLPARPGLTEYEVYDNDDTSVSRLRMLGVVSRRRGGWWRSYDREGHIHGSWYRTRREAAHSLLPEEEL